jgi:hypothetical protein
MSEVGKLSRVSVKTLAGRFNWLARKRCSELARPAATASCPYVCQWLFLQRRRAAPYFVRNNCRAAFAKSKAKCTRPLFSSLVSLRHQGMFYA